MNRKSLKSYQFTKSFNKENFLSHNYFCYTPKFNLTNTGRVSIVKPDNYSPCIKDIVKNIGDNYELMAQDFGQERHIILDYNSLIGEELSEAEKKKLAKQFRVSVEKLDEMLENHSLLDYTPTSGRVFPLIGEMSAHTIEEHNLLHGIKRPVMCIHGEAGVGMTWKVMHDMVHQDTVVGSQTRIIDVTSGRVSIPMPETVSDKMLSTEDLLKCIPTPEIEPVIFDYTTSVIPEKQIDSRKLRKVAKELKEYSFKEENKNEKD